MTDKIERQTPRSPMAATLQMTNPLSSRALFWRARYRGASDFLPHLPFVFWLTEVLRPVCVVEVGLDDGQSYFALCQAVERLNLPARCNGIFLTDPAAATSIPDAEQITKIEQYNADNYDVFSKLSRHAEADTLTRFEDHVIDLLVIGPGLSTQALQQTLEMCESKLSNRAVVLLRGFPDQYTETERHALARRFGARHQSILLENGASITAILVGDHPDERLAQFASLKAGSADYNTIHMVFSSLGKARTDEWNSRSYRENAENAQAKLKAARGQHAKLQAEIDQLTKAYDIRSDAIATALSENFDLKQQIAEYQSDQRKMGSVQNRVETELHEAKAQLKTAQTKNTQLTANLENLRAEQDWQNYIIRTRTEETDALTQELAKLSAQSKEGKPS